MKYQRIGSSTYVLMFVATFLLDRITKLLALHYAYTRVDVTSFLSFVLEYNRGISWGLFDSDDSRIFCIVSCIIVAIIIGVAFYTFVCWMNHQRVFGQILVMSGALSNLVDRVIHHGVVDFIAV
ncbi:MAG TPA: signal peptidase II, partial [Candidatus Limnocylindria bacterium]|nr:signal peptidase II [Candidatus Limnocylindria bacterium]